MRSPQTLLALAKRGVPFLAVWAAGVLVVATGCGSSSGTDANGTLVQILWLGSSEGRPAYGVTNAEVTTSRASGAGSASSDAGFAVDMSAAGRTGEQWQAAAWTAAAVGAMLSGADPRGVTVSYKVNESIDGPSAGAVLTSAVLADLRDSGTLSQQVTMTGTVLPSGALGPVGGIPAKLRAAAEAGIETVLVPPGEEIALDSTTKRQVVVSDLAAELGVEVVPVANVQEALGYFGDGLGLTGAPADDAADLETEASPGDSVTTATPPPPAGDPAGFELDPQLRRLFTEQANLALQRLFALPIAAVPDTGPLAPDQSPSTPPQSPESPDQNGWTIDSKLLLAERQRITSGVVMAQTRVPALLAEGRVIDAFARATLAEREVLTWNATARTSLQASVDLASTRASIVASANTLATDADAQLAATVASAAQWPLVHAEQLTALPDALSWATDAWAVARVVESATGNAAVPPSDIAIAAGLLAASRYDVEVYLPVSAELARQVGRSTITDQAAAADILATYAELLSDTGQAVSSDAVRAREGAASPTAAVFTDPLAWEAAILEQMAGRWRLEAQDLFRSTIADIAGSLSTAMSYYVAGATWAATSQLSSSDGPQRTFSKTDWDRQVLAASDESTRTVLIASSLGADANYVRWNEAFGRSAATAASAIGATDAVRLNGLQVQWYGNVQGHMLVSLMNGLAQGGID